MRKGKEREIGKKTKERGSERQGGKGVRGSKGKKRGRPEE